VTTHKKKLGEYLLSSSSSTQQTYQPNTNKFSHSATQPHQDNKENKSATQTLNHIEMYKHGCGSQPYDPIHSILHPSIYFPPTILVFPPTIHACIHLFIHPSIHPSIHSSIHPSIIHPSFIHSSIYPWRNI
jgi:hypothetical protein